MDCISESNKMFINFPSMISLFIIQIKKLNAIYLIKTIKKNEAYALSACRVSDIIDLTKIEIQLPCHEKLIQNICLKQITRKHSAIIQFRGKNAKASLENIQSTQKNKKQRRLSKFCFEIISTEFKSIFNYLIFQRRLFTEKSDHEPSAVRCLERAM